MLEVPNGQGTARGRGLKVAPPHGPRVVVLLRKAPTWPVACARAGGPRAPRRPGSSGFDQKDGTRVGTGPLFTQVRRSEILRTSH